MNNWVFEEREGQRVIDGKVRYPDYLNISLTRAEALSVIEKIARQLGEPGLERVDLYIAGTLSDSDK